MYGSRIDVAMNLVVKCYGNWEGSYYTVDCVEGRSANKG